MKNDILLVFTACTRLSNLYHRVVSPDTDTTAPDTTTLVWEVALSEVSEEDLAVGLEERSTRTCWNTSVRTDTAVGGTAGAAGAAAHLAAAAGKLLETDILL